VPLIQGWTCLTAFTERSELPAGRYNLRPYHYHIGGKNRTFYAPNEKQANAYALRWARARGLKVYRKRKP
jgi:hypothetical protein